MRARRLIHAGLAATAVIALLVTVAVWRQPLPDALHEPPRRGSVRVLDRNGRLLANVRAEDGAFASTAELSELPEHVVHALLAAEDARFWSHAGVDPWAMARAFGQFVWHRRLVSGASTLTQQLARQVVHRPRTLRGKLREIVVALRIERELDKKRILQEYLNRVEFGPNTRGLEAASRRYFDKPAAQLSLAEAATLAAIPRGPVLYDPLRGTERVKRRRNRILARMVARDYVDRERAAAAELEPVTLHSPLLDGGAEHLVVALTRGKLGAELNADGPVQEIRTTIDLGLQRELRALVSLTARRIAEQGGSAAAALIVDNASDEVLAYVGSPEFFAEQELGQNDGTRALRQPGSTLKPFVYAAAIEQLGLTGASLLPDVELHFPGSAGAFSPQNYDRRFHGPVRLREALANSLNVPAVYLADRLGPTRVLDRLHDLGFDSLNREPAFYGAALALGDGEVRLAELAAGYAALARGGVYRPLRFVRGVRTAGASERELPRAEGRRVLAPQTCALVSDILSDPAARSAGYGTSSVLDLPFATAAKTGTSKGYRDNWTVGYTREVTVAVWVGNFDGRPLQGSSGVTGAGPLFQGAMLAAMRGKTPAPLREAWLVESAVCPLSGQLPGPDCPHRALERFVPGSTPSERCTMHQRVPIDPTSGLRVGADCPGAELRVFERYPAAYAAWAASVGRPTAPEVYSARCAVEEPASASGAPSVVFPYPEARFVIDPGLAREQQQIVLRGRSAAEELEFLVDDRLVGRARAPFAVPWRLEPGLHELRVRAAGMLSTPVRFAVN